MRNPIWNHKQGSSRFKPRQLLIAAPSWDYANIYLNMILDKVARLKKCSSVSYGMVVLTMPSMLECTTIEHFNIKYIVTKYI